MTLILLFCFLSLLIVVVIFGSTKIIKENQRGVVFRLGRFAQILTPGLSITVPFIDKVQIVDLATDMPNWAHLKEEQIQEKLKSKYVSSINR